MHRKRNYKVAGFLMKARGSLGYGSMLYKVQANALAYVYVMSCMLSYCMCCYTVTCMFVLDGLK